MGQVDPPAAFVPLLGHQGGGKQQGGQRPGAQLAGNLQQGGGGGAKLLLRQVDMPGGGGGFAQHIFQGAADAAVAGRGDAEGDADPVGGPESDAFQIVAQAVGIGLDDFLRALSVEQGNLHGKGCGDPVGLQEDHPPPGGLVFPVAFGDLRHAFRADAGELRQALRMFGKDVEGFLAEMADDLLCDGGADAFDQPASEVTLNAEQRGRRLDFAGDAFELPPVGPVLGPLAGEHGLLAGAELRQRSDDGDLFPPGADGQHRPAVFRIAENGSQDPGFQFFHSAPPVRCGSILLLCHSASRKHNGNKRFFRKKTGRRTVQ